MRNVMLSAALILTVAACGGGGGGSDSLPEAPATPATPAGAEGIWTGTTSDDQAVSIHVLDSGAFYVLYSAPGGNTIDGVLIGSGTYSGNTFSSTAARDFNFVGLGTLQANIIASFVAAQSLDGQVLYSTAGSTVFTSRYAAANTGSPSLAALAGTFTGGFWAPFGSETATVTVTPGGALSGMGSSGCAVTGLVAAHQRLNVFNLSLTFGSAPCELPGQTLSGIIRYSDTERRAWAMAATSSLSSGILFVGTK